MPVAPVGIDGERVVSGQSLQSLEVLVVARREPQRRRHVRVGKHLVGFVGQGGPGHTPLEQQGDGPLIDLLGRQQAHHALAAPLAKPFGLQVRLPGFDMSKVEERINNCLAKRPTNAWPPPPAAASLSLPN